MVRNMASEDQETEEHAGREEKQRSGQERRKREIPVSFPERRTGEDRRGASVKEQVYEKGDLILQEGALGDRAYIITDGSVEVSVKAGAERRVLAMLGPGEIFGEMGLIEDHPRSATVTAVEHTSVKIIDRETFSHLFERNPKVLLPIVKALFERLRTANAKVSELTVELESSPDIETRGVVLLKGATRHTRDALGGREIEILRFPFRVGRYSERDEGDVFSQNDLMIEDESPYNVSRNHFAIDWIEDGIWVVDRGSRLGTIVDGKRIGGESKDQMVKLREGQNKVIAGTRSSPFRFIVTVRDW